MMLSEDLKKLSKRLGVDLEFLESVSKEVNPESEQELLRAVNDIKSIQNESGMSNFGPALDIYVKSRAKTEEPVEEGKKEGPETKQQEQSQLQTGQSAQTTKATGPVNPASVNFDGAYAQGYQFQPKGPNDLTGQCAWFAEKITRLPNGSSWTIGNTISEKRNQLQSHKQNGNAYLRGEEQPQVGQSVILDTGTKWGHVAVVSEVLSDGRIRLTESNWDNDQRVRHDRIIDPNDKSVVGFVKSKPTAEFKVGQSTTPPEAPTVETDKQVEAPPPAGKQELPVEAQEPPKPVAQTPEAPKQDLIKPFEQQETKSTPESPTSEPTTPQLQQKVQPKIEPQVPKMEAPKVVAMEPVKPQPQVRQPQVTQPEPVQPKTFEQPKIQQPQMNFQNQTTAPKVTQPQPVQTQMPQNNFINDKINKLNNWFRR